MGIAHVVVIPTVSERSTYCEQTAYQWHNLGYDVTVSCQSDNIPCSPKQHGIIAIASLRKSYNKEPLVFCEDDVSIDRRIADIRIPEEVHALTFYLPGKRFYPRRILTTPILEPEVFQIINLKEWFGTQCIWLSSSTIEALLEADHAPAGFDTILRTYLLQHNLLMHSIIPNLVQHLSPPSITSKRYHPHKSITFGVEHHA